MFGRKRKLDAALARKKKDEAADAFARGKLDKAAKLFAKLAAEHPRDPQLLVRLGEVERRRGNGPGAIAAWIAAGQRFTRDGHLLRAIAAYKLVLEVQPGHAEAEDLLAELHAERLGQPSPRHTPARGFPVGGTPGPAWAVPPMFTPGPAWAVQPAGTPGPAANGSPGPAYAARPPGTPGPARAVRADGSIGAGQGAPLYASPGPAHAVPAGTPGPHRGVPTGTPGPGWGATPGPGFSLSPGPAPTAAEAAWLAGEGDAAPIGRIPLTRVPAPQREPSVPIHHFQAGAAQAERLDELLFDVELDLDGLDAAPIHPRLQLPPIPLFADLAPEAFRGLIARSRHVRLQPGEYAVREGERAEAFFVVVRGQLEVVRDGAGLGAPVKLARIREGSFFGEMALLGGSARTASVWAVQDTELLEFSSAELRALLREHASVADALRRFYRQRLLANALATAPLFRALDMQSRAALLGRFRTREVAPGEPVIKEGTEAEGLFLVLHGTLDVVRSAGAGEQHLAVLREGELFGEQSLLHNSTAGATCRARSRGMVLRLPPEDFGALLDAHPAVRSYVANLDRDRQRRNRAG